MKLKKLSELKKNEILGKDITTWDYQIILPAGAEIKEEYIQKLKDLGIEEVYIKEEESTDEIVILKTETGEAIRKNVKDILERHTYQNSSELANLSSAADSIISNILEEEKVVEKIFDIKERSADIYEHSISICSLAIITALKLGLEISKIHDIGVGCLLHDIGLRYTTVNYSNRALDTLDKQEMIEYKKHPIYGYSALKNEEWLSDLSKAIILYHHERMDGSGFPLKTKEIPFECRIVNVCDTFDEMICGIGYERVKVYEAIEYLKQLKEIMFDKRVVDTFLEFTAVYPAGSHVLTNEGELAVVLRQNKNFQDRPVIRIIRDKNGKDVREEVIKDLVKIHSVFIEKAID